MSEIPLMIDEPTGRPVPLTVVLAHGAGAAMDSPFMNDMARGLAGALLRVARFEFPYMQEARRSGKRTRPDSPSVLEATWLRVVEQLGGPTSLVIGGNTGRPNSRHYGVKSGVTFVDFRDLECRTNNSVASP